MKQTNLSISFDEEKLTALKRYMGKKEMDLESKMADALAKLYEKYVPAPVREYIDENAAQTSDAPKPKRTYRTSASRATDEVEVTE